MGTSPNCHLATISRGRNGSESFKVIVRPSAEASAVIVNVPGYRGDISGYLGKYDKLGAHLASRGIGAFIQMPNREREAKLYARSLRNDIGAVCEYAAEVGPTITGSANPDIFLMGFSAGGGGVAAVAASFPQVKKILLAAPSSDAGFLAIKKGLGAFTGEVYIVIGDKDDIVGPNAGEVFRDMAKSASHVQGVIIPNCDHQFRGTTNGKILSKAPLWAFAGDTTFPSPDGGLELY